MPKRRWNLDRGTWPAIEQIVHLSQQRTQLDDFLRRPTDHRGRGWIPSGYRTGNTSSYLLGYSSCFFHSIDPILYAISTIPLYYVGHSESCWLRGPSRSVSITNLPFSLLFYFIFFVYKKKKKISRCFDIGKFAFTGSVRRRCSRGDWTGMKPACFGLSQENDYARKEF